MFDIFHQTPAHWNLSKSVYSSNILKWECHFEKFLRIQQTADQTREAYSFLKGVASLFVKIPFCIVSAAASLVEGVARLIFAGVAVMGACCSDVWRDVAGNVFDSAVSMDSPNENLTALVVFVASVSGPFTEIAFMIPKLYEAIFIKGHAV